MTCEFLFVLWSAARTHEREIADAIAKRFRVTRDFEVEWPKRHFAENLAAFYGWRSWHVWRNKARKCGTDIMDVCDKVTPFEEMKKQLDSIKKDYKTLLKEQSYAFAELFNRVKLNLCYGKNQSNEQLLLNSYHGKLDLKLVEKMADYGRYLLISSSVGCEYPANLQGLWNGAYSPAWACTFFNNENIQMAYWQAYAGDLKEATLPLFNLYEKFMQDYRYNAKNLFGCKGILLPLFYG